MEIISWLFLIWDILAWEGLKKCHASALFEEIYSTLYKNE